LLLHRHLSFLKSIFLHSLTAFGGAQGHLGMVIKTFVDKRKDISKEELMEYVSFSQILPGASSTQVLTLIGFKRGGIPLAILTLLVWVLPACIIMGLFSFLVSGLHPNDLNKGVFKFFQPMAIGFLAFAGLKAFKISINSIITFVIFILSFLLLFLFFKTPWVFPLLIILGGIATNFSNKRIPDIEKLRPKQIRWSSLWLFIFIFIVAGFFSELSRKQEWENRKAFNLFENFYRFGSIVFGGSDVLIPLVVDQYVARPTADKFQDSKQGFIKLDKSELLTGAGFVRAIPGPVFSIASFTGGIALKEKGKFYQALGCLIGSIAIFLPSALLVLFFFPVWQFFKKYVIIFRALEGINAVVVGVMFAGIFYLLKDLSFINLNVQSFFSLFVIFFTVLILKFSKIPPPFIVAFCLSLGFLF
jgi:chromate transporter